MKARQIIKESIASIIGTDDFSLEHPADEKMGDYASNLAMVTAKETGKNPKGIAEEMAEKLRENKELMEIVKKVEVAGPGFINFWVKDEYLAQRLTEMYQEGADCGKSDFMRGKKVLVEYSSPNIAKRFSVGHLRSTIIGQAVFNLYKNSGAAVTNDNHLGDWGTQFGMIIAAVEEKNLDVSKMSVADLEAEYVEFNKSMDEKPERRDLAKEAFARLEKGDTSARQIWKQAIEMSMKEFEVIYEKLGVKFDHNIGESDCERDMPLVIELAKKNNVAIEGERGALIVPFEDKHGKEIMPPAMVVKSDGTTTYFTRDLATIYRRLTDPELQADLYIYEVGSEQKLHLKQTFETARKLWPEETKNVEFVHIAHGMLSLPEGKMSTRKGNTIKLEDLLSEANQYSESMATAHAKYLPNTETVNLNVDARDLSKISMGAVKYNELKRSPVMNYVFRWEEALSMEGNSAPYLQYVWVRTKSVLEKANVNITKGLSGKLDHNEDESELLRWLVLRFGEGDVVEAAAKNYAPQQMCAYLFELAQKFNGFYERNKVIGDINQDFRLLLVAVTGIVIKNGLGLLGIDTVEKM